MRFACFNCPRDKRGDRGRSNITAELLEVIEEPMLICSWKNPVLFEIPAFGTIASKLISVSKPALAEETVVKSIAGSKSSPLNGGE